MDSMDNYALPENSFLSTATLLYVTGISIIIFFCCVLLLGSSLDTVTAALAHQVTAPLRASEHLLSAFILITDIGEPVVIVPILIITVGLLLSKRRLRALTRVVISGIVVFLLVTILKDVFDVARPEGALLLESSGRFPSGHTAVGTFLAIALWDAFQPKRRMGQMTLVGVLVIFAILMALSRIVLNVHAPLDLLASVSITIFSYSVSSLLIRKISSRKLETRT